MGVNKKKRRVTYSVVEVSNAPDMDTKQYYLGEKSFYAMKGRANKVLAAGIVCVILSVAFAVCLSLSAKRKIEKRDDEIHTLTTQMDSLLSEKEEIQVNLDEKIMAEQEKEAIDAMQYVPSNYPVTGVSTVVENIEVVALSADEVAERPMAVFSSTQGSCVMAAGSGTVLSVEEDAIYGFKLTIDHGNGYISLYYNGGNPMVKKGDAVTKETVLFEISGYNSSVGFQIIENGVYISPMSLVEIQG